MLTNLNNIHDTRQLINLDAMLGTVLIDKNNKLSQVVTQPIENDYKKFLQKQEAAKKAQYEDYIKYQKDHGGSVPKETTKTTPVKVPT